jgi:hypothetical protein
MRTRLLVLALPANQRSYVVPPFRQEWQEAEQARMQHQPFHSNPGKFCFMNPHRRGVQQRAGIRQLSSCLFSLQLLTPHGLE